MKRFLIFLLAPAIGVLAGLAACWSDPYSGYGGGGVVPVYREERLARLQQEELRIEKLRLEFAPPHSGTEFIPADDAGGKGTKLRAAYPESLPAALEARLAGVKEGSAREQSVNPLGITRQLLWWTLPVFALCAVVGVVYAWSRAMALGGRYYVRASMRQWSKTLLPWSLGLTLAGAVIGGLLGCVWPLPEMRGLLVAAAIVDEYGLGLTVTHWALTLGGGAALVTALILGAVLMLRSKPLNWMPNAKLLKACGFISVGLMACYVTLYLVSDDCHFAYGIAGYLSVFGLLAIVIFRKAFIKKQGGSTHRDAHHLGEASHASKVGKKDTRGLMLVLFAQRHFAGAACAGLFVLAGRAAVPDFGLSQWILLVAAGACAALTIAPLGLGAGMTFSLIAGAVGWQQEPAGAIAAALPVVLPSVMFGELVLSQILLRRHHERGSNESRQLTIPVEDRVP